jgi:hypothetical protein
MDKVKGAEKFIREIEELQKDTIASIYGKSTLIKDSALERIKDRRIVACQNLDRRKNSMGYLGII